MSRVAILAFLLFYVPCRAEYYATDYAKHLAENVCENASKDLVKYGLVEIPKEYERPTGLKGEVGQVLLASLSHQREASKREKEIKEAKSINEAKLKEAKASFVKECRRTLNACMKGSDSDENEQWCEKSYPSSKTVCANRLARFLEIKFISAKEIKNINKSEFCNIATYEASYGTKDAGSSTR